MKMLLGVTASISALACALIASDAGAQTAEAPAQTASSGATPLPNGVSTDSDIVVVGLRRSLAKAADIKKNSDEIVDSIVAEDIGKLPDNNAAEAVARIPGVQIGRRNDEAFQTLIRGLDGVTTTLNGRESFIVDGRSFALQEFAADSLAGIDVFKANTAVNLEAGTGGLINVRLRRAFDLPEGLTIAGGARAQYYDLTKNTNGLGNLLISNRWQTGIGEIGLLTNVAYFSAGYNQSVRYDGNQSTPDARQAITPGTNRNFNFPGDVGLFFGQGFRARPSATISLQWAPDNNTMFYVEGFYQALRAQIRDASFGLPLRLINNSIGVPLTDVVLSPENGPLGRPILQSATVNYTPALYNGGGPGPFFNGRNIDLDTIQAAIGGTKTIDRVKLSADIAYTDSWQYDDRKNLDLFVGVPFSIAVRPNAGYGMSFTTPGFDPTDPVNYRFRGFVQEFVKTRGTSWQGRFDGVLDTDNDFFTELDWGLRASTRTVEQDAGRRDANLRDLNIPLTSLPGYEDYTYDTPFRGDVFSFPGFAGLDANKYRKIFYSDYIPFFRAQNALRANPTPNFFIGNNAPDDPTRAYEPSEQVYSFYAQAKFKVDVGFPIDGILGARITNTVDKLTGTQRSAATGALIPIDQRQNYVDILPNASARARFTDKLQLRLSYTESLIRPGFGQLNPSFQYNTTAGISTGSRGNPDLNPVRSKNYDASLEYYFSRAGSVTLAVFQKDVNGFIVTLTNPNANLPGVGPITLTQPFNAGKGRVKGVEAAFSSFLTFLPSPLDGLGVQANLTYLDGKQQLPNGSGVAALLGVVGPIPNVSKWTYNLTGFYEKGPVGLRVSYNYRSKFLTNYNSAGTANTNFIYEYTKAVSRLDASGSFRLTPWLTLTADATNLLGKPFENYQGYEDYPRDTRYESRTYTVGARFRF